MDNKFLQDFYDLCTALSIVEQLEKAGYMTGPDVISARGAEQILGKRKDEKDLTFSETYREKFRAKNIGIAGKTSDPNSVANKMARFRIQYPYSEDVILEATDMYFQTVDNPKFIMEADYFIFKRDGLRSEEKSKLASFCELVVEREGEGIEEGGYGNTL